MFEKSAAHEHALQQNMLATAVRVYNTIRTLHKRVYQLHVDASHSTRGAVLTVEFHSGSTNYSTPEVCEIIELFYFQHCALKTIPFRMQSTLSFKGVARSVHTYIRNGPGHIAVLRSSVT